MKHWNLWLGAFLLPTACVVSGVTPSPYADEFQGADTAGNGGTAGQAGASGAAGQAGSAGDPTCGGLGSKVVGDACVGCLQASCCDAFSACSNDVPCATLLKCLAACTDAVCAEGCQQGLGPESRASGLWLKSCWAASCADPCPVSEAATNLVGGLDRLSGAVVVDCTSSNQCANAACLDCNADPADACESSIASATSCGACGRTCGDAACDPHGICVGEVVDAAPARGLALRGDDVVWMSAYSAGTSTRLVWQPLGASSSVLDTWGSSKPASDIVPGPSEIFYSAGADPRRVAYPPSSPNPTSLTFPAARLFGQVGDFLHMGVIDSGGYRLWRIGVSGSAVGQYNSECVLGYNDGALLPDGTLFFATQSSIVRFLGSMTWTDPGQCNAPKTGEIVVDHGAVGLVATSTRIAYAQYSTSSLDLFTRTLDATGQLGPEIPLGAAHQSPDISTQVQYGASGLPIAVTDQEVYYVEAEEFAPELGAHLHRLMRWNAETGARTPLAMVTSEIFAIRVSSTHVYWADASQGVLRTPR